MTTSLTELPGAWEGITDTEWQPGVHTWTAPAMSMLTAVPRPIRQFEYPIPGGNLVISVEGDPPVWLDPTAVALTELLYLAPNWDSYGARPIDRMHVFAALDLLVRIMQDDTPAPTVVPTNRGGVQLEWHTRGIDLEIETLSLHRRHVSFEDSATNYEWEGEIASNLTPLVDCIGRLSRHGYYREQ